MPGSIVPTSRIGYALGQFYALVPMVTSPSTRENGTAANFSNLDVPLRARAPDARADQAKISPEESCRKARIHSLVRAGMPKTVGGTRIVRPVHAGGRAPSARAHREAVKDLNARLSEKGTNDRVRPQRFRDPCSSLRKGARVRGSFFWPNLVRVGANMFARTHRTSKCWHLRTATRAAATTGRCGSVAAMGHDHTRDTQKVPRGRHGTHSTQALPLRTQTHPN